MNFGFLADNFQSSNRHMKPCRLQGAHFAAHPLRWPGWRWRQDGLKWARLRLSLLRENKNPSSLSGLFQGREESSMSVLFWALFLHLSRQRNIYQKILVSLQVQLWPRLHTGCWTAAVCLGELTAQLSQLHLWGPALPALYFSPESGEDPGLAGTCRLLRTSPGELRTRARAGQSNTSSGHVTCLPVSG